MLDRIKLRDFYDDEKNKEVSGIQKKARNTRYPIGIHNYFLTLYFKCLNLNPFYPTWAQWKMFYQLE